MKILITGAKGFIGKNLAYRLKNAGRDQIYEYGRESGEGCLKEYCADCDIVFHLAGVNRPESEEEFARGNVELTRRLTEYLEAANNPAPILFTSSTQAVLENPYGVSKYGAEQILESYGNRNQSKVMIFRMPNVFGKWSRPEYNSAVATFCYKIARSKPIRVNDPAHEMDLLYIDDLTEEFAGYAEALEKNEELPNGRIALKSPIYHKTLGEVAELIRSFPGHRRDLTVPRLDDPFVSKLYSTYLSFLPPEGFSYPLDMKVDERGSFTEFIRTPERGQVSVNISHPGIIKGQHWHDSKNEKFLVARGKALIRFRRVGEEEIIDYHVSGEKLQVVEIPTGYVHCIINEGDEDLVTIMWANEAFDPQKPDTWREEV
ncbi:MAG: NAD-dependent epimerase/dehydratase family protein [Lachnospiraceae bacterium]|nr:NAD-dependent epimerase/dehydratase family protein [Lachnospiraceae bacterium]